MLFCQIMDYRDTRAYILDPCIQEFFQISLISRYFFMILYKQEVQFLKTCSQSESLEETNHDFTIHIWCTNVF